MGKERRGRERKEDEGGEKEGLPPLEWRSGYAPRSGTKNLNRFCSARIARGLGRLNSLSSVARPPSSVNFNPLGGSTQPPQVISLAVIGLLLVITSLPSTMHPHVYGYFDTFWLYRKNTA